MKFLSRRTVRIIGYTIRLTAFFRVSPFLWNSKLERVEYISTKSARITWHLIQIFYFTHQIFLGVRFGQSLHAGRHGFSFYAFQASHFIMFLVMTAIIMSFTLNSKEWITFLNHQIQFFRNLEGKINVSQNFK